MNSNVLLVEDDENFNFILTHFIKKSGFNVVSFTSAQEAMEKIKKIDFDIAVLDVNLGEITGFEILRVIKKYSPETQCIMITAYGNINDAIKAIKEGAFDYILKPFKEIELIHRIQNALKSSLLEKENQVLRSKISTYAVHEAIIGKSPFIQQLKETVKDLAQSEVNVFISGETGTGKEVVAKAIHNSSKRSESLFESINCASIPENLIESELFGYVKGAFTGAVSDRKGKFEIADKGTIFLDEITEMPLLLQAKLLRVIQEMELEPVGSNRVVKIDVRFISASNKIVEEEIKKGVFRQDLFYRLNIFPVELLPLREYKEDIPLFIKNFFISNNYKGRTIAKSALDKLMEYDWPGNIRELEDVLHYSIVNAKSSDIKISHLPDWIVLFQKNRKTEKTDDHPNKEAQKTPGESEREIIIEALKKNNGNKSQTARELGLSRVILIYKMKKLNIIPSRDF